MVNRLIKKAGNAGSKPRNPWDKVARKYEAYMQVEHYAAYEKALARINGKISGKVLVCPCGTGEEMRILSELGNGDVVGCDKSKKMVEYARKKNPGAVITQARIEELPFKNQEFGTAISINGFELFEDWKKAIGELARVVSGRIFVGTETPGIARRTEREFVKMLKSEIRNLLTDEEIISGFREVGWKLLGKRKTDIDGFHSLKLLAFGKEN